ncbi:MAG: hypothetical protein ACE5KA_05925 [Nitrososphaerales archaeon]
MSEKKEKQICPYCKHDTHKGYLAKFANGELQFSQCDCGCKIIHGVNMPQSKQAMKKLYKKLKKELHKA